MTLPPTVRLRRTGTHRLVPSKYADDGDSVLALIADDPDHLQRIFELDAATNDRLLAPERPLPGLDPSELVAGVRHAAVINAAFCHPHPLGARFNGPDRGTWYAAFELETAQAEVGFHKTVQLIEIDRLYDSITYDDYLADFRGSFHDLRRSPAGFEACLAPDSYVDAQALAEHLLAAGSSGVIYPSVRRAGGTCLACFRPSLVGNVRRGRTYRFTWEGTTEFRVTVERKGSAP